MITSNTDSSQHTINLIINIHYFIILFISSFLTGPLAKDSKAPTDAPTGYKKALAIPNLEKPLRIVFFPYPLASLTMLLKISRFSALTYGPNFIASSPPPYPSGSGEMNLPMAGSYSRYPKWIRPEF